MIQKIETPYIILDNTHLAILDGNSCTSTEQLYTQLIQLLCIPDYFGKNLDALDEVLHDLSWIEQKKCILLIININALLIQDTQRQEVLNLFDQVDNSMLQIIEQ